MHREAQALPPVAARQPDRGSQAAPLQAAMRRYVAVFPGVFVVVHAVAWLLFASSIL